MDITSVALIPYLVSITVVLFMFFIQATLLLVAGVGLDFDADHDVDLDADIDVDLDVDVDVDVDVGVDVNHDLDIHDFDVDHDVDIDHDFSLGRALSPLGVGQVPLSIVFYAYALSFGIGGIASSFLLSQIFAASLWFLFLTIPISLVIGWHATKHSVKFVAPLLKTSGAAECKRDIVGREGRITSINADEKFGEAVIMINGASNHVIIQTDNEIIEKHTPIVVIDFDEESKRPIVSRLKA
jgi:hypothetical protein